MGCQPQICLLLLKAVIMKVACICCSPEKDHFSYAITLEEIGLQQRADDNLKPYFDYLKRNKLSENIHLDAEVVTLERYMAVIDGKMYHFQNFSVAKKKTRNMYNSTNCGTRVLEIQLKLLRIEADTLFNIYWPPWCYKDI